MTLSSNLPLISIIVINFNGKDYLLDCFDSIFSTKYSNFEVILIDNNSSDGSSDECKQKFPQIRLFKNKKNLAMAARNVGLDAAKGDYVVFLDADTVVTDNWLNELLKSYQKNGPGLYQGKLLKKSDPSIIESCGDMANIYAVGFARGRGKRDKNQFNKFEKITFAVGACTFSEKKIFNDIGYVDESELLFLMLDDLDYCWRGWLLNYPSYYEPKCVIYHVGSPILQWSPKKFFYLEKNRWICILSLYSKATLLKIFPMLILYDFGLFVFYLCNGLASSKIRAFFTICKLLPKIIKRRKAIQQKRNLDDRSIIQHFVDYVEIPSQMNNSGTLFNSLSIKLNQFVRMLI